ncbi:MAG: DUF3122 domain-containing protein [Leptolyngbyaceae bacterium]|nr:DUF3122 domain-containing protein [Leptolyngbyaceae bacterium]
MLCGIFILGAGFTTLPALAAIQQIEEAPGQMLYQSRHTLQDQHGHPWRAIAFNRILPNGSTSFYVRLVGFPGMAEIDRSQPLMVTTSLGETLTASDASSKIFTDASTPEPHIGQYDLQPIVSMLQPVIPIQLSLPTLNSSPIQLSVSPSIIQEWQTVAAYDLS